MRKVRKLLLLVSALAALAPAAQAKPTSDSEVGPGGGIYPPYGCGTQVLGNIWKGTNGPNTYVYECLIVAGPPVHSDWVLIAFSGP